MAALLLITILFLNPVPAAEARELAPAVLSVGGGLGWDGETGESSPFRWLTGIDLALGALDLRLLADCGMPWEPAPSLSAEWSLLNRRAIRLDLSGQAWLRTYAAYARELGCDIGAQVELGRRWSFLAAGGWAALATDYLAAGTTLTDSNPWARLGVVLRPSAPARTGWNP
jgi:hypothetical protein